MGRYNITPELGVGCKGAVHKQEGKSVPTRYLLLRYEVPLSRRMNDKSLPSPLIGDRIGFGRGPLPFFWSWKNLPAFPVLLFTEG